MKKKEYRTPYCISIHIDPREILAASQTEGVGVVEVAEETVDEDAGTRQQSLWTNWES